MVLGLGSGPCFENRKGIVLPKYFFCYRAAHSFIAFLRHANKMAVGKIIIENWTCESNTWDFNCKFRSLTPLVTFGTTFGLKRPECSSCCWPPLAGRVFGRGNQGQVTVSLMLLFWCATNDSMCCSESHALLESMGALLIGCSSSFEIETEGEFSLFSHDLMEASNIFLRFFFAWYGNVSPKRFCDLLHSSSSFSETEQPERDLQLSLNVCKISLEYFNFKCSTVSHFFHYVMAFVSQKSQ